MHPWTVLMGEEGPTARSVLYRGVPPAPLHGTHYLVAAHAVQFVREAQATAKAPAGDPRAEPAGGAHKFSMCSNREPGSARRLTHRAGDVASLRSAQVWGHAERSGSGKGGYSTLLWAHALVSGSIGSYLEGSCQWSRSRAPEPNGWASKAGRAHGPERGVRGG